MDYGSAHSPRSVASRYPEKKRSHDIPCVRRSHNWYLFHLQAEMSRPAQPRLWPYAIPMHRYTGEAPYPSPESVYSQRAFCCTPPDLVPQGSAPRSRDLQRSPAPVHTAAGCTPACGHTADPLQGQRFPSLSPAADTSVRTFLHTVWFPAAHTVVLSPDTSTGCCQEAATEVPTFFGPFFSCFIYSFFPCHQTPQQEYRHAAADQRMHISFHPL